MEKRHIRASVNDEILLVYVDEIRSSQPRVGTRKLYSMLSEILEANKIKLGRDKFFDLLRKNNLLVKKRRSRTTTTNSNHVYRKYPNLILEYVPTGPEQIVASDITYLSTEHGPVFLSLITDQYSKKIMGHHVHPTLETDGPLEALNMALRNRRHLSSKLIHHSDRGIQYCCKEYTDVLVQNNIQISMSAKGNPYENAIAERVNGILKSEFYLDRLFKDIAEAKREVHAVITVYNTQRFHASCDYLTPEQAHDRHGILKKRWTHYKPKKKLEELKVIGEDVKKAVAQLLKKHLSLEPKLVPG